MSRQTTDKWLKIFYLPFLLWLIGTAIFVALDIEVAADHLCRFHTVANRHVYVHDYEIVGGSCLFKAHFDEFKCFLTIRGHVSFHLILLKNIEYGKRVKIVVVDDENSS